MGIRSAAISLIIGFAVAMTPAAPALAASGSVIQSGVYTTYDGCDEAGQEYTQTYGGYYMCSKFGPHYWLLSTYY